MNLQTLSTAQKLPTSDGLTGGYTADGRPGPLVRRALGYVDHQIGQMVAHLDRDGLTQSTTVIVSAKHGQSPEDPKTLRRVDDGAIIDGLDRAWAAEHPAVAPLVAFATDDDGILLSLSDRSRGARAFAQHYLLSHRAPANIAGNPKGVYSTSVSASGLTRVFTGRAADKLFGAPADDPHAPDLVGIAQRGVVYTGDVKKITEHGGFARQDRHVARVVAGPDSTRGSIVRRSVHTTQIAPTILDQLGLDRAALQAVRREHTKVLPKPLS